MEKDYKKLYEEEHKKYEDALGRARGHHSVASHYNNANEIQELEHIFPELCESEDERIRKWIIEDIQETLDVDGFFEGQKTMAKDAIAWLEKQGHGGKKWIYEDVYLKEKEQTFQDGIDEVLENPQKYGLEKQDEQKPAWSEEDEMFLNLSLGSLTGLKNRFGEESGKVGDCIHWLKSLKDRIALINKNDFDRGYDVGISAAKFNQWRPTEEQMDALADAIESYCGTCRSTLNSLYNNLKKL